MAIYDYLPKYNYIEANNLKGLQPGFVVAQNNNVDVALLKDGMFENGKICTLDATGKIVAGDQDSKVLFIHYTEPLNTIYNSDVHFAVKVAEECPRLVQLIPGDEWMSTDANLAIEGRIIQVTGTGFLGVTTMANGDRGYHYMYLG